MNRATRALLAMGAIVLSPLHALAGAPSLIAGLHRGDELRYTYTLTTDETIALTGKTGPDAGPMRALSTQTVGVVFRVAADTTATNVVEATFETVKVAMEAEGLKFEVDVNAAAPGERATAAARDAYAWFRPLVGARLTLNVAPGSGEITTVQGGEDALKAAGAGVGEAGHLRRYLDADLFRATFGPVFQLKSNSVMPPPGEKWYIKTHAYARGARAPVWETRRLELVEGDVANVKAVTRASARPEDAAKSGVFFRGVDTSTNFWWDTLRGRLTKARGTQTIATRFDRLGGVAGVGGNVMQDSDLVCTWTLEMTERDKAAEHPTPTTAQNTAPSTPGADPAKGP